MNEYNIDARRIREEKSSGDLNSKSQKEALILTHTRQAAQWVR